VSRVIDAINFRIGKILAWLILAAVIVSAVNAIIRKVFDVSSNSWLELQWVLFGAVFLIVASWTLLENEHIRIDIVNSQFSQRTRNIIDIIGHAFFLLPLTIIMIITGYPFVMKSVLELPVSAEKATVAMLVVGASVSGHASSVTDASRTTVAYCASGEVGLPVSAMMGTPNRSSWATRPKISSDAPLLESRIATSFLLTLPKSPCSESIGCRNDAGVPVEVKVAAILRAISPDLPTPETMTRPSTALSSSIA
jgi:TRAP-type mannitol/chloroaromatic compound transport system permease small subunit